MALIHRKAQLAVWRTPKWRKPAARKRRVRAASIVATSPAAIAKANETRRIAFMEASRERLQENAIQYQERQRLHQAAWVVIDAAATLALSRVKPRYHQSVREAYELFRGVQFREVPTGVGGWVQDKTEEAKLHKRTSRIRARLTEELLLIGRADLLPYLEPMSRTSIPETLATTA